MDVSSLLSLVRKAELTRSEVQILIDLLLNKQHEAPTTIDEWTEVLKLFIYSCYTSGNLVLKHV